MIILSFQDNISRRAGWLMTNDKSRIFSYFSLNSFYWEKGHKGPQLLKTPPVWGHDLDQNSCSEKIFPSKLLVLCQRTTRVTVQPPAKIGLSQNEDATTTPISISWALPYSLQLRTFLIQTCCNLLRGKRTATTKNI